MAGTDGTGAGATMIFVEHDSGPIEGTLYRPTGEGPFPAVIAVHGGGWMLPTQNQYGLIGPALAAAGIALFAVTHRLARDGAPTYPEAVHDVRAAVQFVRANAGALWLDPDRLALIGDSSGGHLAALVALAGDLPPFTGTGANGDLEAHATRVKACSPIYAVLDLAAQWQHDQVVRFNDHIVPRFLGVSLADDRRPFFEASPPSYISRSRNGTAFLVAWGTDDDVVDCASQSEAFVVALKQAGHFVRALPVPGAPHSWVPEPLDEPWSYSGFYTRRLIRFLKARL